MKKSVPLTIILTLIFTSMCIAQNGDPNQEYIKAMTTSDVNQRARLLKDYVVKYKGRGTQYENFVYANLCVMQYSGKTPSETIEFGEKAIALGGLDDTTKVQVLLTIAGLYANQGQNLEKAKNYGVQIVQIAKGNKKKEGEDPQKWNQLMGAGYFVQGQAMEKAKNYKEAASAYSSSYSILKNKQILPLLFKSGKGLYEAKAYSDAAKAFKTTAGVLNDFGSITYYARALHRSSKKNEALTQYKKAYTMQKSGEIAYSIGIIMAEKAKKDPSLTDETVKYLLQASFLSPKNSKQAMSLAEGLYFSKYKTYNEKVKLLSKISKELETLTNTFNSKYGDKEEEDLTDAEIKEMNNMLIKIDSLSKEIDKIQVEQQSELEKFKNLIKQTKESLGVK